MRKFKLKYTLFLLSIFLMGISVFILLGVKQWQVVAADASQIDNVTFDLESGQHNIIRTSSGTLYAVLAQPYAPLYYVAVYKSSDGNTWTEQDSSNRPEDSMNPIYITAAAIDSNDNIHIAGYSRSGTAIRYIIFDTSSDIWGPLELVTNNANASSYTGMSLVLDSNDKPHIIFNAADKVKGTDYWNLYYQNKTGAGWLATDERVDTSDTAHSRFPTLEIDAFNTVHVAWLEYDGTTAPSDPYYRKRTSAGTWDASPTDLGTATAVDVGGPVLAINSSGEIMAAWTDNATDYSIYYNLYSSGSWGGATDTGSDGKWVSLGTNGSTNFYFVFVGQPENYAYYRRYDGSMGNEAILNKSIRIIATNVKYSFYNNNQASSQLDYLIKDESNYVYWNKLDFGLTLNHYRWRDDSTALNTDGGWIVGEDTPWTTTTKNTLIRLRIEIANTGLQPATSIQYQLEYAQKSGFSCGDDETFLAVPTTTDSFPFVMATSSQYADGATITALFLTGEASATTTGRAVEYPSNKTSAFDLATFTYTEFEYAIKATNNAKSFTYCFRLTNNGTTTDFIYSLYPELTLNLPTSLTQYESDHDTVIPTGTTTTGGVTTTIYLDFDVKGSTSTDVITPKVEVEDINTAFDDAATATGTSLRYDPEVPRFRSYPAFVYDSDNERAILFSGMDDTGTRLNDSWELLLSKDESRPIWRQFSPGGTLPEARNAAAFIYDELYDRLVVFGGRGAVTTYLADFWVLDFSTSSDGDWYQFTPTGSLPSGRYNSAAIYDSANQRIVIYAGYSPSIEGDVWGITLPQNIDNSISTELSPSGTIPDARLDHSLIYDSANQRMILFGGADGGGTIAGTFELDFSTTTDGEWNQLSPSGGPPSSRSGGYIKIYDSQNQRMIITMGYNDGSPYYNDIWELTLPSSGDGAWTDKSPTASVRPKARRALVGIYDQPNQRMVAFGGRDVDLFYSNQPLAIDLPASGTLYFDELSVKVNLRERDQHKSIYDPLNHRMVMFGGFGRIYDASDPMSTGYHLNETWALSASGTIWRDIGPSVGPQSREGASIVYDSANDRMILFGGLNYNAGSTLNDIWALSLATSSDPAWTRLSPTGTAPSARWGAAAVYDSSNARLLIFGGSTDTSFTSPVKDVWELNFTTSTDGEWTERTPASGGPSSGRWMSVAVYDPGNTRMLIFGGRDASSYYDELWELEFSAPGTEAWTDRTPASGPTARRTQAIYQGDYSEKRMIIFGGYYGGTHYNEVWKLDITTPGSESWEEVSPGGAPVVRRSHTIAYDSDNQKMLMYGGRDGASPVNFYNDTWEITLQEATSSWAWTELSPTVLLRASVPVTGLTAGTSYHWQGWFTSSVTGKSIMASYDDNSDTPPADVDFQVIGLSSPGVTTDPALNVQTIQAQLNGTLNDLGGDSSADVWFEWGTSTFYGSTTIPQNKTITGAFSDIITGLATSTTYHFRVAAQNIADTSYGLDEDFITSGGGPSISDLLANDANPTDYCGVTGYPPVRVSWIFDPGYIQSAFEIEVATSSDFVVDRAVHIEKTFSSSEEYAFQEPPAKRLSWSTTYYWRVRAWDSSNTTSSCGYAGGWCYPPSPSGSPTAPPGDSFSTISHGYPYLSFTFTDRVYNVGEIVTFEDDSSCYNGGALFCKDGDANITYAWDFDYDEAEGFATSSTYKGNATTAYSTTGKYTVKLKITDNSLSPPGICTKQSDEQIRVGIPLPEWREIAPFSLSTSFFAWLMSSF